MTLTDRLTGASAAGADAAFDVFLDWAGERGDVGPDGDQRLPRARRRREDDVVAAEQLDDGLVLVGVELEPLVGHPAGEGVVDRVGVRARPDPRVEARWVRHASIQPLDGFSAAGGVQPW